MPERDNPYVMPDVRPGPVVENEEIQETVAVDPRRRDRYVLSATIQTVTVDPLTGGRRFIGTTNRVRSDDQRLINPNEDVYPCECGRKDCANRVLTKASVKFCAKCQKPIYLEHSKIGNNGKTIRDLCPKHYWQAFPLDILRRFFRWLKKI